MRRYMIILILLLTAGALTAAAPPSLLSDASFGLFTNEIDAASVSGEDFLELEDTYIFGGLANLSQETAQSFFDDIPVEAGYHQDAEFPWSVFLQLHHTDPTGLRANTSQDIYDYATLDDEGVPIPWVSENIKRTYAVKFADTIDDSFRFIRKTDDGILGADLYLDFDCSAFSPFLNLTETTTFYYDASDDPGTTEPQQEEDYTVTERSVEKDSSSSVGCHVLKFMPGDDTNTTIGGFVGLLVNDLTERNTRDYSLTQDTTQTVLEIIRDDSIDRFYDCTFYGYLDRECDSLFGGTEKGLHYGAYAEIGLGFAQQAEYEESMVKEYTPGEDPIDSTYNEDSTKFTFSPVFDIAVGSEISQLFSYDLGGGLVFRMRPGARADISYEHSSQAGLKKWVERDTTDVDDNGKIEDAVDTIVTTTYEAENSTIEGNTERTLELELGLMHACALNFQPKGWMVGFTMGADLRIGGTMGLYHSRMGTYTATTVTSIAGEESTLVTRGDTGIPDELGYFFDWETSIEHDLCINIDLAENFSVYIDLNSRDLLDLGDLTVQAVVAL